MSGSTRSRARCQAPRLSSIIAKLRVRCAWSGWLARNASNLRVAMMASPRFSSTKASAIAASIFWSALSPAAVAALSAGRAASLVLPSSRNSSAARKLCLEKQRRGLGHRHQGCHRLVAVALLFKQRGRGQGQPRLGVVGEARLLCLLHQGQGSVQTARRTLQFDVPARLSGSEPARGET